MRSIFVSSNMKNMKRHSSNICFLALLFICGVSSRLEAQQIIVYPGDVNNNGVVNNIDFMQLGLAYDYFGPARIDSISNPFTQLAFVPQLATPWSGSFPGGVNHAHADCDGDGTINFYNDAFPIFNNYGMERPGANPEIFSTGITGENPEIWIDTTGIGGEIASGSTVSLPIMLGRANKPAQNVQGIAFTMNMQTENASIDGVEANFFDNSWINNDGSLVFFAAPNPNDLQKVDVAITRTDHNHRTGFGQIGNLEIIIIIDIVDLQGKVNITFENIRYIDKLGNSSPAYTDSTGLIVKKITATAPDIDPNDDGLKTFPNPTSATVNIASEGNLIQHIELFHPSGAQIKTLNIEAYSTNIDLTDLPSGSYFMKVYTERGVYARKILKK